MHGQIHDCLRCMMLELFDKETYKKILEASTTTDTDHFRKFTHYDDSMTINLIVVASQVLDMPLLDVLEAYGIYWVKYAQELGYGEMLDALGPNVRGFLENVDTVHTLLSELYEGFVPPMYRCEQLDDGNLNLHYLSYRPVGLQNLAMGVIKGTGKYMYNLPVVAEVTHTGDYEVSKSEILRHGVITVTLTEDQRNSQTFQRTLGEMCKGCRGPMPDSVPRPVLTKDLFCIAFPYIMIFGIKDMTLSICGSILQKFCPNVRPGQKLKDICEIVYPRVPFSGQTFLDFVNVCFFVNINATAGSAGLRLKGQMIPMDKDHLAYVCSPKLKNMEELLAKGIYLADLPIYDSTRQYVMLNQVRNAEISISAKLAETTAELEITHAKLDRERAKTDALICEMLPRKVADQLKAGIKVPPEKFKVVTILFSNVVGFAAIASSISPIEIIDLLNTIYTSMDDILHKHNVYKVETVGSTYVVISGAPDPVADHCEQIANLALEMSANIGSLKSPLDGKQLELQIGIHSGPIVCTIIGEKMPRYCLFGDTVNVSSRMMSHCEHDKINVSPKAFRFLYKAGYVMDDRGVLAIKGKGNMHCYYLLGQPGCTTKPLIVPGPPDDGNGGSRGSPCCVIT